MECDDDTCSTRLALGLGFHNFELVNGRRKKQRSQFDQHADDHLLPSLSLGLSEATHDRSDSTVNTGMTSKYALGKSMTADLNRATSPHSNCSSSAKRSERDMEAIAELKRKSTMSDDDEDCSTPRKKLRLSKEQISILEDNFKSHTTLNPKQKEELARQLSLQPRQVEVWFQNRRARIKLKQTEVDCETLRRRCETLGEVNRRLQEELQELKSQSLPATAPFLMQISSSALPIMCPSCKRIGNKTDSSPASFLSSSISNSRLCDIQYSNPSAAC